MKDFIRVGHFIPNIPLMFGWLIGQTNERVRMSRHISTAFQKNDVLQLLNVFSQYICDSAGKMKYSGSNRLSIMIAAGLLFSYSVSLQRRSKN